MSRLSFTTLPIVLYVILCVGTVRAQYGWQKYSGNPVVPYWSGDIDDPNGYKYALEPTVRYDSTAGVFRMYFISEPFGFGTHFFVSTAISLDGVEWYVKAKNPVFRGGGDTAFDVHIRQPRVLFDGTQYWMYYTAQNPNSLLQIGLAISSDGESWQRYAGNPILTPGAASDWDSSIAFCEVVRTDSMSYMWYGGGRGGKGAIGLATSGDGYHWTKSPGNPVFVPSVTGWDSLNVGAPCITVMNGTFYMFYLGAANPICCSASIGLAQSSDGVHWTRGSANPILSPGSGWEDLALGGMSVLIRHNEFHLWYTAQSSSTNHWEIGYASSPAGPLTVHEVRLKQPGAFKLYQSFPNPFNPDVEIGFDIPRQSPVTITIINSLGQEIETIVNELEPAGHHSVAWHSSNRASGVYFYRLQAGNFTAVKKMILAK